MDVKGSVRIISGDTNSFAIDGGGTVQLHQTKADAESFQLTAASARFI